MSQGCNSDDDKDFYHIRQDCWNKTKINTAALASIEISHNFVYSFLTKTANLDELPSFVFACIVTLRFLFLDRAMVVGKETF